MFTEVEVGPKMKNAVAGVWEVLKKLSYQSPQAENYHNVLSNFSEAITLRREQIAEEYRQVISQYLDRIRVIDFQDGQDRQYPTPTSGGAEVSTLKVESVEN